MVPLRNNPFHKTPNHQLKPPINHWLIVGMETTFFGEGICRVEKVWPKDYVLMKLSHFFSNKWV